MAGLYGMQASLIVRDIRLHERDRLHHTLHPEPRPPRLTPSTQLPGERATCAGMLTNSCIHPSEGILPAANGTRGPLLQLPAHAVYVCVKAHSRQQVSK